LIIKTPEVSVIIPAFNTGSLIKETVRSAINQSIKNIEILIIDDASTDDTPELIRQLEDQDSRVRSIRLERNSNLPAVPRNVGLREARAKYVALLDHDDLWQSQKLERQLQVMQMYPNTGLIHSALLPLTGRVTLKSFLNLPNISNQRSDYESLRKYNQIICSSVLLRTDVALDAGGFDERPELRAVEDFHLWLRISKEHDIRYISEIQGVYRVNSFSTSAKENMDVKLNYLRHLGMIDPIRDQRSSVWSKRKKIMPLFSGLYFHSIDATFRKKLHKTPRLH
jgi:teichuronic acid biosynthesis glycosyltransferase TuaG